MILVAPVTRYQIPVDRERRLSWPDTLVMMTQQYRTAEDEDGGRGGSGLNSRNSRKQREEEEVQAERHVESGAQGKGVAGGCGFEAEAMTRGTLGF